MSLFFRRMAHGKPMARPDLGPPPESAPPSQMQRGIQALAFVATAFAGAYCVLIYDWRPANLPADAPTPPHIFTPARNKFFSWWKDWTTLSESDRAKWEAATGQKLVAKDQPESGASGKLV